MYVCLQLINMYVFLQLRNEKERGCCLQWESEALSLLILSVLEIKDKERKKETKQNNGLFLAGKLRFINPYLATDYCYAMGIEIRMRV